ncbi:hypothetical protein Ple7327_1995 [Pleurocapsa sp. PCC 7327]|uniref:hypothetical protein n=1 Tax=Pleurocapsa sp. PCC 7327 TaxID=118163 RepID=UPI00029F899E|nr:hypothetical protein [Pleurocapsa sp. PCC 7327]AFY77331.1 hypothetical protein Ple7327_1995 [Pleurocapsa sp. PCC 7327]
MSVNYQGKIITLWTTFLLGTIFHTDLGLMPLFHGKSVAHSHEIGDISWVMWLMLAFFVLPMFAIIATAFTESKRFRVAHFGLTVFYSVMNLLHIILDLFVTPIAWYQITLMVILFAIGLLLNVVSFQWMQHHPRGKRLQEQVSF